MKNSGRLPLVLLLALGGCFGGGGGKDKDKAHDKSAGGGKGGDPAWMVLLRGMKVVPPVDHLGSDGRMVFSVGDLEATMPAGWTRLSIAGQTKYISPTGGESIQISCYTSEAALDDERMREVALGLSEMGAQGERLVGRWAKIDLSTPTAGKTAWGADVRFSALGPLNRMSFHYSTAAPHEAIMIQFDGNPLENTPAHAVELIRSFHYKGKLPAPAAPSPTSAPAR